MNEYWIVMAKPLVGKPYCIALFCSKEKADSHALMSNNMHFSDTFYVEGESKPADKEDKQ